MSTKNNVTALVAFRAQTASNQTGFNLFHRALTHWYNDLEREQNNFDGTLVPRITDSDEEVKEEILEYKAVSDLRAFILPHNSTINVPTLSGTRLLLTFSPFVENDTDDEIKNIRLAKCILMLELLADPNLPMNVNDESWTVLGDCFDVEKYDGTYINLLFSYGLSFNTYVTALRSHLLILGANEDDMKQLSHILSSKASSEEKDHFAELFQIHRDSLNVTENNDYIHCYNHLYHAYDFYTQNRLQDAADEYQNAEDCLQKFEEIDGLNPLLVADYSRRRTACKEFKEACRLPQVAVDTGEDLGMVNRILSYMFPAKRTTSTHASSKPKVE